MANPLDISDVEIVARCGLKVRFSDGSSADYPAEELAFLRPYRVTSRENEGCGMTAGTRLRAGTSATP